jgi:hypothetical protein
LTTTARDIHGDIFVFLKVPDRNVSGYKCSLKGKAAAKEKTDHVVMKDTTHIFNFFL